MLIKKVEIEKFRGFENVKFELGSHLTVISGQNGTQKTTLLGLLTQPFTITDKNNPMFGEKPLSGENFRSDFSDKFKLSKNFDKIGGHKWTLFFDDNSDYTAGSIDRGGNEKGEIRIWKVSKKTGKAIKTKGSGYVQLPVIYLSLKRLLPIGEDDKIKEISTLNLTKEEEEFYAEWHNKILILTRDEDKITTATSLESPNKQTLGANTNYYDWQTNSAGQDNIGKILLAILSFKRLKYNYPDDYKGGVLAIDEIDTTFYPGSQIKLLEALTKFASKFKIQIIFTTHSLTLLKEVSKHQEDINRKDQIKLIYLIKKNEKIEIKNDVNYLFVENHLNRSLVGQPALNKINVYTEDREAIIFIKSLLGVRRNKHLNFVNINFPCSFLIELALKKVPSFIFPNSILILDGDVKKDKSMCKKVSEIKNILLLPTDKPIEKIISDFLYKLPASNSLWGNIDETFDHEYCFKEIDNSKIQNNRDKAKTWFNYHLKLWGSNSSACKVLTPWKQENENLVNEFTSNFDDLFKKF